MVIFLHITDHSSDPLILKLAERLQKQQRNDGGWVAYDDQPDNVSASTLAYFALRLADCDPESARMQSAEAHILRLGGLMQTSNLTKVILASAGQLPWTVLPDPQISTLIFSRLSPVNLYDFASFTRVHIPSIMILSHLSYQAPIPAKYSLSNLLTDKSQVPRPRPVIRNIRAIDRCRQYLLGHLEPNGTIAGYLTATAMAAFALQAIGLPRDRQVVERMVEGVKTFTYQRGSFLHQQVFSSTVWDTALCARTLQMVPKYAGSDVVRHAVDYLLRKQQSRFGDWRFHTPNTPPGGWGFSNVNTRWPDVDDTLASLTAIRPFIQHSERHQSAYRRGLRWMLAMQNDDGGWSAFDRNCNKSFLERNAFNDMGRAVTDPSTADITGRAVEFLHEATPAGRAATRPAVRWLLADQRHDGSWFGRWGIAFLYGTAAALQGLRAAGVPPRHPVCERALTWLEGVQNDDGGFGESCASDTADRFVPLNRSVASQTAWGLLAMMAASSRRTHAIDRAVQYLLDSAREKGGWLEAYPTGAGVAGQAYLRYHSYPQVWPTIALCTYRERYARRSRLAVPAHR